MKSPYIIGLLLSFALCLGAQSKHELATILEKNKFLFSDGLYSHPSTKASSKSISKVGSALVQEALGEMLAGTYPYEYRLQEYRSYLNPKQLSKELKISDYSQFENPTGIFFTKDETVALVVDNNIAESDIQLRINNFGKEGGDSSYKLIAGVNIITPENDGNGYIQYFTEDKERKNNVRIHILGGKLNGYFDVKKHNNEDWKCLLSSASGEILDIVGSRVQLAYDVNSLNEFCPEDGLELVALYDTIVTIQHGIMGLNKYNRVPENHVLGRVIWKGFMHADGWGAGFTVNVMNKLANPAILRKDPWGVAHEFGHVNQVRPWMKWVGTTEVTNNIYSVWSQYLFNTQQPKLEREVLKDYDGKLAGARITSYMESAFIHQQEWLTQAGPDRWQRKTPRDWGGDHFVKLVPLWQLQLYYTVAGKGNSWYNPDFYADIYIDAINKDYVPKNDGEAQLAFIKKACDVTKTDLTDFFTRSGLLRSIDKWVDDYTCSQMTITEKDIEEVKQYAAKYNKIETPVMHYITANSVDYFKEKRAVTGELNKGVSINEDGSLRIDHNNWRNVVAFETYSGDHMIKISFGGAGSTDNMHTVVRYPETATRVEAVAWDGTRHVVYNGAVKYQTMLAK